MRERRCVHWYQANERQRSSNESHRQTSRQTGLCFSFRKLIILLIFHHKYIQSKLLKEYKSARDLYSKQQLLLPSTPWPGAITLPFAVVFVNRCRAKQVLLGAALAFDVINRLAPQHQHNQLDAERQQLYQRIYEQQTKKTSSTSTSTTTTKQRKVQQIEVKIIINNAPAAATPTASTASAATPAGAATLRQVSVRFSKLVACKFCFVYRQRQ